MPPNWLSARTFRISYNLRPRCDTGEEALLGTKGLSRAWKHSDCLLKKPKHPIQQLEGHPIRVIAAAAAEWRQNRSLKENIADNWYHPDLAGV